MDISRRTLLQSTVAAGVAAAFASGSPSAAGAAPVVRGAFGQPVAQALTGHGPIPLRWLEGGTPAQLVAGTTWGVPWPRGALSPDQAFALISETGDVRAGPELADGLVARRVREVDGSRGQRRRRSCRRLHAATGHARGTGIRRSRSTTTRAG